MARVVGIDHLVIRVSDYEKSKAFYGKLFSFLGFEISDEYEDMIGWTNGKTRFWIGRTDEQGRQYSTASAMWASTTMRSNCAAARTSTNWTPSCVTNCMPRSSIRRGNITTIITRCSFSIPTG